MTRRFASPQAFKQSLESRLMADNEALQSGPQTVTRQGEPVVVVVAIETWRRVSGASPDFKAFLRAVPLDGLDLSRDGDDRPLRAVVAAPGGR